MKIGYIVKEFPRLSETFILNEMLALEAQGCELVVFSRYRPKSEVPHAALQDLRAEVKYLEPFLRERFWEPFDHHRQLARRFGEAHDAALGSALAYRSRQELRYWMLAGVVAEQAITEELDHLHAHFATGNASVARYAAGITGVPFSFTAHAKDIYTDSVDRDRLSALIDQASAVVTVSDENLQFLNGVRESDRIERIYNGLDLHRFKLRPVFPVNEPPVIVCVARLVEKKGHKDLVDAVAMLRDEGLELRCKLVGDGPLEEALRAQVARLSLEHSIEFVGAVSQEQIVADYLGKASVYVLPCVLAEDGDRDGLPTTIVEAMALGVPVVSTTLPGIPEAIPHEEAGLLADPGDSRALAAAIRNTVEDPSATAKRVRVARARIDSLFDVRENTRDLLQLFRRGAPVAK